MLEKTFPIFKTIYLNLFGKKIYYSFKIKQINLKYVKKQIYFLKFSKL